MGTGWDVDGVGERGGEEVGMGWRWAGDKVRIGGDELGLG